MNRWKYENPVLADGEVTHFTDHNVRIFDGNHKTDYDKGELIVTNRRLIWARPGVVAKGQPCLTLDLRKIAFVEEESPPRTAHLLTRSRKIVIYMPDVPDEIKRDDQYSTVTLFFRDGCVKHWVDAVNTASWRVKNPETAVENYFPDEAPLDHFPIAGPSGIIRTGIISVERELLERQRLADSTIGIAFRDLKQLMAKATDMVRLVNAISTKIRDKQGEISADETVRLKSFLLGLGIADPVTRSAYKSNRDYFAGLALETNGILLEHVHKVGGMMTVTDAYCWVNRARGLHLVAPSDLLAACEMLEELELPLRMHVFSSGVKVLQLAALSDEQAANDTATLVQEHGSLNVEQLVNLMSISFALAQERLLMAEQLGKCCRDDSFEGLRFFPNRFLTE